MRVNLANWFTMARIFLAFPIFFLLISDISHARLLAVFLFCFAGLTDYLDGKIARIFKSESKFGKFFDPFADKILVISVLTGLVILKEVPAWMVLLIGARELLVTFLRAGDIEKFSPTFFAKSKTAFQMCGITIILFLPFLKIEFEHIITYVIMTGILLSTLVSGIQYCFIARRKM